MKRIIAVLLMALSLGVFAQQRVQIVGDQSGGAGTGPFTNIKTDSSGNLFTTAGGFASGVTMTNTTPTITNSTTVAIALNASRKYLQIQNNDSSGIIYCTPTAAATTTNGVKLTAGQFWAPSVPPTNAINCIGSIASNANVIVTEGQ